MNIFEQANNSLFPAGLLNNSNTINIKLLKDQHPIFNHYDKDFDLIYVPPMGNEVLENFEANVTREFRKIKDSGYAYYDYKLYGGLENYNMVVLRDKVEFTSNLFTTFSKFCEDTIKDIVIYGDSESSNISSVFFKCEGGDLSLNDFFYEYLAQAYFGFIKEHRIKIILASHPKCISGEFNLYRSDRIGDLYHKTDLFIFRNRPQKCSLGFWKSIGIGSKTTKNLTEENCSIVIHNGKDLPDNYAIPDTWIYVKSKESIYTQIEDLLGY